MTASKPLTGTGPGTASPDAGEVIRTVPPLRQAIATLIANRTALAGIIIIVAMLGFSFIGPLFYHTNQISTNLPESLRAPNGAHPLGTDNEGYDVLGRLMIAGQSSLEVGLAAAAVATLVGVFYGAISGFAGGLIDGIMMRFVDGLLAIPTIFLLIFLFTVYNASTWLLVLVIGLVAWLVPARLIRAETLSLRTREYVQSVRVIGGTRTRMIIRHIIPNAIGTIMVNATFQVADAILALAALGFLGLGVQPPATNWGAMLSTGVNYVYAGDWWLIYPAGVAILLTVMAFNAVGDGLRDVFEVRLKRR